MTRGAPILWPRRTSQVLDVIELHIETLFESVRKALQRWTIAANIRVADRAHRHVWRSELRQMTARAIFVARETGPSGIVIAMMTARASNGRVTLTGVQEL